VVNVHLKGVYFAMFVQPVREHGAARNVGTDQYFHAVRMRDATGKKQKKYPVR
jgi:hypothetical protein